MSEFLAEARILVRPDTTKFRAELVAELAVATRGVTAPVQVVPVTAGAGLAAVAAESRLAAAATSERVAAEKRGAETTKQAIASDRERVKSLNQVRTAAIASGASLTGLRGAVLTAGGAFIAATIGIQAFSRAVGSAAALETELNVFQVTAGATADQMERVSETARELGRDLSLPGVTATDAAQTFLALSRAGLSVQDSLDGARGVLQLAVAAQINFADAAQLTASALNAFALNGDQAINVADLLTNAANESQASIADMGIALRQSAAIADLVGFSLSETVTFLTQLAQAGLSGSDAGTSFRVAMQRLIAPTDAARNALERLNVNLRDASGNLRPEAFFDLGDALERMSRAQADATRQIIFGNDASRAAAFFARLNADSFREQEEALTRQGAAAEVAGARNEGFAGKVENLKNQVTALGIELGELALPAVGVAADVAAQLFGTLATSIANTREEWRNQIDDINEVIDVLGLLSDESGFTDFVNDVNQGGKLLQQDFERAGDAVRGFIEDLFGLGGSANAAGPPVRELTEEEARLAEAIHDAVRPTVEQTTGLNELAAAAQRAAQAVRELQGQERGLAEQVTRARIAGDEQAELQALREQRTALERELAAQEAIIARPGKSGDAAAREAIRQRILPQLEAVNNEIDNIIREQQSRFDAGQREREAAQQDAIRARNEADRAFLDQLSGRREDAANAAAVAAAEGSTRQAIRAQDRLQALIRTQIEKIRDRIKDEQTRAGAIRALRQALNASRREEDELRQQQIEDQQSRREEIQNLNIQIAQETGNRAALERAINARINTLNKQIKAAKGDQVRAKQLILERERLKNQLKELTEQQKETGKAFNEFAFEFLQTQQGFASNLLGNLIPTNLTSGLVGQPSPPQIQVGAGISAAAGAAAGRDRLGSTAGQFNQLLSIEEQTLSVLIRIANGEGFPEARYQKAVGGASMDVF